MAHIKDLIESLPKTTEKNRYDDIDLGKLSIHARLADAIAGRARAVGLKPLSEVVTLDETKPKATLWDTVVIPDGTHAKLAEAIVGPLFGSEKPLPENIHARAAKALCR